jgi:transposase
MWTLGIDWAEKHLDYCLLTPSGDVSIRGRVDNNETGFSHMLAECTQQANEPQSISAAIESAHQPVVNFLIARQITVYPVNPTAIFDYRKSVKGSGSKSDTADAELIARYLREHYRKLRAWHLPEPQLRQLQLLVEDRDKVVTEKVRLQNQLRSTLLGYFPQAALAFSNLSSKAALDFLSQFPTPESLQAQSHLEWQTFLDDHRIFHKKARQRFLTALKQVPMTVDTHVVSAKSLLTEILVCQLRKLTTALVTYQERIDELLNGFDDSSRFKSLPGIDTIVAAKLLVHIGTDRQRFATANELQTFFGTAPYTKSSGQSKSVHFRRACHKGMRTALQQMALSSLRKSQWAKAYFDKKRKEGKKGSHAMRCLANLWLKVIFAIWKTKKVYSEDKHLAAVARHQISQPI